MSNYIIIPVVALLCYVLMGLPFLASKYNRQINAFLWMLLLLIFWTAGSFLMRIQFWPNTKFWYDFSLMGLTMFPCGLLHFINSYVGRKSSTFKILYVFPLLVINLINIQTGYFLASPELVIDAQGKSSFIYHPTWAVLILFISCIFVLIRSAMLLVKYSVGREKVKVAPIIVGLLALFVGHVAIMIPAFSGIPLDIASGVVYASCLFYALYKKRLFRLNLFISRGNCCAIAVMISLLLLVNFSSSIEALVEPYAISVFSPTVITALFFAICTQVVYWFMKSFIDHVFIKDEVQKAIQLKEFSQSISNTLWIDDILEKLIEIIRDTLPNRKVCICISKTEQNGYAIVSSSNSLDEKDLLLHYDNPIVQYLKNDNEYLLMKEFRNSPLYKSMWEKEKQQLARQAIDCIVPLKGENDLSGMIILSERDKKHSLSEDDLSFLSSVSALASIAVKNSMLYERARIEARTDELTGVLNRKYFYETLNEEYEKTKGGCLSLIILNIDDFKLYNQLYGNREGDIALQKIAKIATACIGTQGHVARYSAKEFAIILPMVDPHTAKELAIKIKQQVMEMNKDVSIYKLKPLTLSIGICSIPYGATTLKQLVENVDMSVYQVKRSGKNSIMVYSVGQPLEKNETLPHSILKENIYSGYASTIYALTAAIDAKDHYTFGHSKNVEYYATCLAQALNLNEDTIEIIREAALLHDVGKIGVPEEILNKKGILTDEEYDIMKGHVESSINIIRHLPSLDYVIPAVIGHHERYDGKGYPRRIAGEDIPLSARILCIADSFDAMISQRCYKKSRSVSEALSVIESEAGKQFDPKLSALFVELVRTGKIIPGQQKSMGVNEVLTPVVFAQNK